MVYIAPLATEDPSALSAPAALFLARTPSNDVDVSNANNFIQIEALYAKAAEKMRNFHLQELTNTLWAVPKTGTDMPGVFMVLCVKAAEMVKDFNALELASTLLTMAKTGGDMPDVLESLNAEAAEA